MHCWDKVDTFCLAQGFLSALKVLTRVMWPQDALESGAELAHPCLKNENVMVPYRQLTWSWRERSTFSIYVEKEEIITKFKEVQYWDHPPADSICLLVLHGLKSMLISLTVEISSNIASVKSMVPYEAVSPCFSLFSNTKHSSAKLPAVADVSAACWVRSQSFQRHCQHRPVRASTTLENWGAERCLCTLSRVHWIILTAGVIASAFARISWGVTLNSQLFF